MPVRNINDAYWLNVFKHRLRINHKIYENLCSEIIMDKSMEQKYLRTEKY